MPTKLPERSLEAPTTENIVFGSHIGLTERLSTNISLLRTMCTKQLLQIKYYTIGKYTNTRTAVICIPSFASQKAYNAICDTIESMGSYTMVIHLNAVSEAVRPNGAYLYSTSKQVERFDELMSNLMQGKIAVICDHTPFALITPISFFEQFQSPDDYYTDYGKYSARIIRILGFVAAAILPAAYVALAKDHPTWIPNKYFNGSEMIPTVFEQFFLIMMWRAGVDSATRSHQSIGIMLTIIIAMVIGENAIMEKLFNPSGVIIAALSIFAGFTVPSDSLRPLLSIMRGVLLLCGAIWGMIGVFMPCILLTLYGVFLRPYGLPYFSPLIPFQLQRILDIFYRGPLHKIWGRRRQ